DPQGSFIVPGVGIRTSAQASVNEALEKAISEAKNAYVPTQNYLINTKTKYPLDEMAGLKLKPGTYKIRGSSALTGLLTLDASESDEDAKWIFQISMHMDFTDSQMVVIPPTPPTARPTAAPSRRAFKDAPQFPNSPDGTPAEPEQQRRALGTVDPIAWGGRVTWQVGGKVTITGESEIIGTILALSTITTPHNNFVQGGMMTKADFVITPSVATTPTPAPSPRSFKDAPQFPANK
ncbi:hypothetical protein B484DRAFT_241400, partial [Ochromonadaceae sp. CCMP2298]